MNRFQHTRIIRTVLATLVTAAPALAQTFGIGGAVYTDLENRLGSGLVGVEVTVEGAGGSFTAVTADGFARGIWGVPDVPEGTYTVRAGLPGWTFSRIEPGMTASRPAGPRPRVRSR